MKIRAKIFLFIVITSSIIFTGVIGYIIYRSRAYSIAEANRIANIYAQNASNQIKATIEKDLGMCEALAQSFSEYNKISKSSRDILYNDQLISILKFHPEYLSVWMSWSLKVVQPAYPKNYGYVNTVTFRDNGRLKTAIDTSDINGEDFESTFYLAKTTLKDVLVDPYYYKYSPTAGTDSILETSITKPIIKDGEFLGIIGVDFSMERFQSIVNEVKPYKNSYALLVSNDGKIISSYGNKIAGDSILKTFPEFLKFDVLNQIKKGNPFSFNCSDTSSVSNYVSFAPIHIGNAETPWAVCIITPRSVVVEQVVRNVNVSLIIGILGIFIFALITFLIAQRITSPLQQATSILKELDNGIIDFSKKMKTNSKDELGEMGKSINNLMDTLFKTADFAKKIGQGDFNANYMANSDNDVLGNALIEMQKNLKSSQEQDEIRQEERQKLNWAQIGLSELGEVLRSSADNFEDYLFDILSQIVKTLKADQGAIFIINSNSQERSFLELKAAYAYEKRKALQARIEIGESLVGRCFQEKETIYMTNIPEGYTFISSGLGAESPRCLFLMPLLFEDEPFGVIELASFRKFADFEIEFIKSTGERIASSISFMQKNVQTKELLAQYQLQSEEIRVRENMMRENLEELQKIQEKAILKEKESEGIIEIIAGIGSLTWYDLNGKIVKVKDRSLKLLNLAEKELIGRNHSEFADEATEDPIAYREFWDDLRKGKSRKRIFKTVTQNGVFYVSEFYYPILNIEGKPDKIINVGFNVTEQKLLEEQIDKLKEDIGKLKKPKKL